MSGIEVKICGLTNLEDARHALASGADFLGFVLYPESPRGILPEQAKAIIQDLGSECRAVAVFVNESRETVEHVAADCGLYAAQLHGDERPEDFDGAGVRLWRAVRFEAGAPVPAVEAWTGAERYLVDAAVPGQYGGSGVTADWDAASALAERCDTMLAGGLTPCNVEEAMRAVNPVGVDVSSGVEAEPGRKDHAKVEEFIRLARRAGACQAEWRRSRE